MEENHTIAITTNAVNGDTKGCCESFSWNAALHFHPHLEVACSFTFNVRACVMSHKQWMAFPSGPSPKPADHEPGSNETFARSFARALLFRQLKRRQLCVCVVYGLTFEVGMWCIRCAAASSIATALVYLLTGSRKGKRKLCGDARLVLTQQQAPFARAALAVPRPHDHALAEPPYKCHTKRDGVGGFLGELVQLGHGGTSVRQSQDDLYRQRRDGKRHTKSEQTMIVVVMGDVRSRATCHPVPSFPFSDYCSLP